MKNLVLSCVIFIAILSASAQLPDSMIKPDEMPPVSAQPNEETGRAGTFHTRTLPDWSIKNEVSTIEKSLNNYDPLIQSLEEANSELKADLEEYLKKPGDEVLAARITMKMSKFAGNIVNNVDTIIADQDTLLTVFGELNQKLDKFNGYLDMKVTDLEKEVKRYQEESKQLEQQLRVVAKKWKSAPENSDEKEKYKQEFQRLYNKYNINSRYKDGFERNRQDYEVLGKNLKNLMKVFKVLNQAFEGLIENLSAEKKYLLDNIRLQADAIRVKKLVHDGITDGHRAVIGITQKLALLYAQVDGFAKVHEKINRDMAKFSDTTKILGTLVQQIEKAPFQSAPDTDKALEYFANSTCNY